MDFNKRVSFGFVFCVYHLLLVERRRNRCFFAILTLRIFEFAKNVLRNSLVLLSIIEGKSLSLSLSL